MPFLKWRMNLGDELGMQADSRLCYRQKRDEEKEILCRQMVFFQENGAKVIELLTEYGVERLSPLTKRIK